MLRVKEEFFIGARKVTRNGRAPLVYLPTRLKPLVGKRVLVTIKVIEDEES